MTVNEHASPTRKISFLLLFSLLGRAGFLAKVLVAEGQFLVWGTRRGPAFFRFRVGLFAPWLGNLLFL
jgi:hypothetical protein